MNTTEPRTIVATETAKLIRAHLKREFPGFKFNVRTDSTTNSISIRWTDGPTTNRVERITDGFAGARFQTMTDCNYGAHSWYCPEHGASAAQTYGSDYEGDNRIHKSRCCSSAEYVHFGTRFVTTTRSLSHDFVEELAVQIRKDCGMDPKAPLDVHVPIGSRWDYGIYSTVSEGARLLSRDVSR